MSELSCAIRRLVMINGAPRATAAVLRWAGVFGVFVLGLIYVLRAQQSGTAGNVLCHFIEVLCTAGIAISFLQTCHLFREMKRGRHLIRPLEAERIPSVLARLEGRKGLMLSVLRSAYRKSTKGVRSIDVGRMFDQVDERLRSGSRLVKQLTVTCASLGAAGTVAGLVITVGGMSQAVGDTESGQELMVKLFQPGGAMAGLTMAFSTTLYGLVATIILGGLEWSVSLAITKFVNHYEELFDVYIIPELLRDHEDDEDASGSTV